MALIFFEGYTGVPKEKVWCNMITGEIKKEEPTMSEKMMDIVMSHTKYDYDLSEIILALRQIENNGKTIENISINSKAVEKHVQDNSFSKKLCELQCEYDIENMVDFPNFFTDLRKLNKMRNTLAHKSFIERFIDDEKIIKIVFDNGCDFVLNLGKQQQILMDDNFESEINNLFQKYSKLCGKYKNFFCKKLSEKLSLMKGVQR